MLLNLLVPDALSRKLLPPLIIMVRSGEPLVILLIPIDISFSTKVEGSPGVLALGDPFSLIDVGSVFISYVVFLFFL